MKNSDKLSAVNKKRWATYAVAGVAALVSGADTAESQITHVVVGANWTFGDDFYFALDGNAALDFYHPGSVALLGVFNNGAQYGNIFGFSAGGYSYASNLASGVNLSTQNALPGAFATLAYNGGYANSQFVNTSGIIGFSFDGGNGTQFGWARLTALGDAPVNSYTIEESAFADVGTAIAAGQIAAVPEPSSLGLLALGALGVLANRRRKTALAS